MNLKAAIRAAASDAPDTAIEALEQVKDKALELGALENERRAAHLIGQCAHESTRFTRLVEGLHYTTVGRLMAVFGRHFENEAHAAQFLRNAEKLANHVYGNRMENGPPESGDGFRFRGRGYLQLTGRENYRKFGERIGIDLVAKPERAAEPGVAWLIAASYLATRKKSGKTALEWADEDNVEMVTRIVNGGINGLEDRRNRTARALAALGAIEKRPVLKKGDEGEGVLLLQRALAASGFSPGALDGDFGTNTRKAVRAFQKAKGLTVDGKVGKNTWKALEPLPS